MKKNLSMTSLATGLLLLLTLTTGWAQITLSGHVSDANDQPLPGVSLTIQGKMAGTITDRRGNFSLSTATPPPFTLLVTSVGFKGQAITINSSNASINIRLDEQPLLGQEVVVAASRVEETVLKSPVTVEKMDIRAIRETPAASFYDGLANYKGIDMAAQGLLFKSVNMRGFGATGNPRTVQMIDGMDNSAPGLNFPIDNIVGVPELDVESVEVLPGAASALYGPNAINGLILMNSKSPFLYQGLSANVKGGVMSASNRTTVNTPFYDLSVRYAKAFNNKLAFKLNMAYIKADDWQATDYSNLNVAGAQTGLNDPARGLGVAPNYDGMNIYGDEAQANLQTVATALIGAGRLPAAALALFPNRSVSRTGFREVDMVDYNTQSLKFNGALHYRLTEKAELVGQFNYGYGTTVYTGTGRYSLRDFNLSQAKVELRSSNYTLRAYTTQERSGNSYTAGLTGVFMNEAIKPSTQWFAEYAGAFAQARGAGQGEEQAYVTARTYADSNPFAAGYNNGMRPAIGSAAYQTLLDTYRTRPISQGGGAFLDKSNMYHVEGVYNFREQLKVIDLLVGANFRNYSLGSDGTLFADQVEGRNGRISINEYGAFAQVSKNLLSNHLKLTGSLRYDKNQNFDGQFTPRVSAVGTFGEHNIRLSYQTGFRIPTTQNQYIDLLVPNARLIGGVPEFYTRYNLTNAYPLTNVQAVGAAIETTGASKEFQDKQIGVLTAIVQPQVIAAVQTQVTAQVTAQVNAAVAAGQLPQAQAAAAIQAGVAQTMTSAAVQNTIRQNITAQVTANGPAFIQAQAVAANYNNLTPYQRKPFKPERVANYEIGYRSTLARKLFVDAYYYYSVYTDFIGGVILVQPKASIAPGVLEEKSGVFSGNTRQVYSLPTNSSQDITASGWALGLNYAVGQGYTLSGNVSQNQLNNFVPSDEVQFAQFNTPKYRWNLGLAKRASNTSKIGFGVTFKHQDAFVWEAGFVQPSETGVPFFTNTIVPAISNLDAQVSYKLSGLKSLLKVGATNIGGKPYIQAYGSPAIGSMYYIGLTFDELMQ